MNAPGHSDEHGTDGGALTRSVVVLAVVAASDGPLGVSAVAELAQLPVSTTHRILGVLRNKDLVNLNPLNKTYEPGPELYRLSALVLRRQRIEEMATPMLREVAEETGETCRLALWDAQDQLLRWVAEVEGRDELRFHIPMFMPIPMIWGCTGRVVLAHLPDTVVQARLEVDGPSPLSGMDPPSPEEMNAKLDEIRERGWEVSFSERFANGVGIAAPVLSSRGIRGALGLTIPSVRWNPHDEKYFGPLLAGAAQRLSIALGDSSERGVRVVRSQGIEDGSPREEESG